MTQPHLRAVDDQPPAITPSGLPDFEGHPVDVARIKLTSVSDLEGPVDANRIDDIVRMVVEGRVVRVDHVVDEASGRLRRVQTVKVLDAVQVPWSSHTGAFDD